MTTEEFRSDEELRRKLKAALADPTLQLALQLLRNDLLPLSVAPTEANPVVAAARYHHLTGAGTVFAGLEAMTTPAQKPPKILPKRLTPLDPKAPA